MKVFPETPNGQALKVAIIFTMAVAVVMTGALGAVNLSASGQVANGETQRLLKGVHALADGDLSGAKAAGLLATDGALVTPRAPRDPLPLLPGRKSVVTLPGQGEPAAKLFGIRMIAWRIGADGGATAVTPLTPDLPAGLANVADPTRGTLAGQAFVLAGASGTAGRFVGAISVDAVQNSSKPFVTTGLVSLPPVLALIFFLSLLVGRASAAPIERNRRRQMEFAADASHELRTPLAVIRAEASLALSKPREVAEYQRAIARISGESAKLADLVDDLLFLARADAENVAEDAQPRDLSAAVSATAQRFSAVATERSIDLKVAAGHHHAVLAPDGWLERLVSVLLDNACRYTPSGGQVAVTVGGDAGHPTLTVDDSGPGIAPEQRPRIFDRFHRGVATPGGSGLGLSIASAVMRRTRGHIEVLESPAGGARIVATWPGV